MNSICISEKSSLRTRTLPDVSHLTLEKIGQTCQIHGGELGGLSGGELADYFGDRPVGSIFLGSEIIGSEKRGPDELRTLIDHCQAGSHIPLSISGDLENGSGGASMD